MKPLPLIMPLLSLLWLASAVTIQAGNLVFRYRAPDGTEHNIRNEADLRRWTTTRVGSTVRFLDPKGYMIIKNYLNDVKSIKDRAKDMSHDITVLVSSDLNQTYPNGGDKTGSWSTGPLIQIQTWDKHRMVSTLAHEVGHSYMRDKCGKNPTDGMSWFQAYGMDEAHYVNEITTERSALSEGYAEYHGDREGQGQERAGCGGKGGLEELKVEGPLNPTNNTFNYIFTKWKDIPDPESMWACEGLNATMLRDFAKFIPNGAAKVEEMICSSNSLKEVVAAWAQKYPDDADAMAKIIDANTNYTMDKAKLGELLQGKAAKYMEKRDEYKAKYKGKDPCKSTEEMFKPGPGTGLPPTGGTPGGGKPGGGGGWPGMKKF